MHIAITTLCTKNLGNAATISLNNKREYAALHNYTFEHCSKNLDPRRNIIWSKMIFIKSILHKYDWVFWIDCDAMIMNYETKLENIIDNYYDLLITRDEFSINAGVFFIRNTKESHKLLDEIIKTNEFNEHGWTDNAALIRCLEPEVPLWDEELLDLQNDCDLLQKRLKEYLSKNIRCNYKVVPQKTFNSYAGYNIRQVIWQPGDFVSHAAGWSCITKHISLEQSLLEMRDKSNLKLDHRNSFGKLFKNLGYKGNGAEIGVYKGEFSSIIRQNWDGDLYLVDCWESQEKNYDDLTNESQDEQNKNYELVKSIFKNDQKAHIIKGYTPQIANSFADNFFDWIYIDANHSYDAVLSDLRAWYPKIKTGGMFCGHDFVDGKFWHGNYGVQSAVNKFCDELEVNLMESKEPRIEGNCFPSWYFIKT